VGGRAGAGRGGGAPPPPPPVADQYLHELEQRVTSTQLTRTRRPSGGSRPLPQSTRLRAQTAHDPPLAQRRLGTHRSPSQGWTRLVAGSPTQGRLITTAVNQRRAAPPTRHNGFPEHIGRPARKGARLTTCGSTQGRRVSSAVNKTTASGRSQPASAQRQHGSHRPPSRRRLRPAAAQRRPSAR
jgi:hypothetical protein